jgi:hypothetical protein
MERPLLNDPQQFPSKEVLKNVLGESYKIYEELIESITKPDYGLETNWNYYTDGKAWLCKVVFKKKTVFWLSVWDKFFKTGFYFTEKNASGIAELDIDNKLKESFLTNKHIGKLIPLTLEMKHKSQISDLIEIIKYKKSLK